MMDRPVTVGDLFALMVGLSIGIVLARVVGAVLL